VNEIAIIGICLAIATLILFGFDDDWRRPR